MSVTLMSMVFGCNMPELKTDDGKTVPDSTLKFVLLAMADSANDEGEGTYNSVDTLCKKTNFSTSTVCNALNALRHNGFTRLVGKSKRDTNNYTILVARIAGFQRLESERFSHRNASVSATETNPLVKPSINPSFNGAEEIFKSANQKVDAILENEKASKGKQWTKLPEVYHPYARAFQESTGIVYTKTQNFEWMSAFDEWAEAGYQPDDVRAAIEAIQAEGKMSISKPSSITWKLRANTAATKKHVEHDPLAALYVYQEGLANGNG